MANGADWNGNNLACVNTWAFLRGFGELNGAFSKCGDKKVSELAFWNPEASAVARSTAAQALASRLDRMFVIVMHARYEDGVTRGDAVAAMGAVLESAKETVASVAGVVDGHYRFRGELK